MVIYRTSFLTVSHPGRFEEEELQVESKSGGEEGVLPDDRDGVPEGEEGLVHHGHHVVLVPQDPSHRSLCFPREKNKIFNLEYHGRLKLMFLRG